MINTPNSLIRPQQSATSNLRPTNKNINNTIFNNLSNNSQNPNKKFENSIKNKKT